MKTETKFFLLREEKDCFFLFFVFASLSSGVMLCLFVSLSSFGFFSSKKRTFFLSKKRTFFLQKKKRKKYDHNRLFFSLQKSSSSSSSGFLCTQQQHIIKDQAKYNKNNKSILPWRRRSWRKRSRTRRKKGRRRQRTSSHKL